MGKYNGAVITTAGANVISQAISGTELTWTVMRSSSVAIPEGTDIAALTSLTGIEQTAAITDASVYGNSTIQVSARFSNTGVSTAYLLETIGIYGQLAGGAETLIAVMTAVTPDQMPVYDADSPSAFIYNSQITVQDAETVVMTVNDTGTATVADLNRKVDLNGGDLSDTKGNTFTPSTESYPVISAGDTFKVMCGKIVKFCADIVKTFTGASATAAGHKGLVPAPSRGFQGSYLRADGSWTPPANYYNETREGYVADARQLNPNIANTFAYSVKQLLDEKVDATYGDISNTRVDTIDTVADEYPTPPQGRVLSYVMGCVKKYLADLKDNKIDADGGSLSMAKIGGTVTADQPYQEIDLNDSVGEAVGKVNYTTLQTKQDIDLLNDSFNGVISSGSTITSLNSATETGFYTIMNSAANKPVSGLAFGYVLVNRGSEGSVIQTVIGRAADNVTVFHFERFSSNGGSSWGAWLACIAQKIETTINVPAIAASGSAQVTLTGYGRSIIPHAIIVRDNKSGRPMIASNWWASGNGLEIIIFNLGAARDAGNVTLEIIF